MIPSYQRMPQTVAEQYSGDQTPKYMREMEAALSQRKYHDRTRHSLAFAFGALLNGIVATFLPSYAAGIIFLLALVVSGVFAVLRLRKTIELIQLAAYQRVKIVDPKPDDEVVVLNAPKNGSAKQPEAPP